MKSYNIDMDISNIIYYLWTHAEASKSHIQTFYLESSFFKIELNFFFFFYEAVLQQQLCCLSQKVAGLIPRSASFLSGACSPSVCVGSLQVHQANLQL